MVDLRLVPTVSDCSLGGRLKRLRSQKSDISCPSYSPRFRSRKVSVARDFPDFLSGFGRNIEQKANDDHACERDFGSCTRDSEPDAGSACDFEDGNVETVNQGPVMANAFADEEFVALNEALEPENAGSINSVRIVDGMTVIVKVEEDGYPQVGNEHSGSIMDSMTLPKRLKVSAVRNFPDAFQQCNGHNGSRKKATAVRDFPVAFKLREEKGNISDFPLVREPVTPEISLEQEKVKSFPGHHLASKESEHREIVQALMAATRCPWSSKKSRGSKKWKCRH